MAKTSDQGFGKMKKEDPERLRKLASEGGTVSGGNFKNDPKRASAEARKRGNTH